MSGPPRPPVTPSPRRFVAPNRNQQSAHLQSSNAHQQSLPPPTRPGQAFSTRTPNPGSASVAREPPRFAHTPRFSLASANAKWRSPAIASPQPGDAPVATQTPRRSLTRVFKRTESIEEASQEADEDEEGDPTPVTGEDVGEAAVDEEEMLLEPVSKRPRLDPSTSTPALPQNEFIHTAQLEDSTPRRFRVPKTLGSAATSDVASTSLAASTPAPSLSDRPRPTFVLPTSPSHSKPPAHPLPETFSPHRRGQKFVPGGMADAVRGWIIDIASMTAPAGAAAASTGRLASGQGNANYRHLVKVVSLKSAEGELDGGNQEVHSVSALEPKSWMLVRGEYLGAGDGVSGNGIDDSGEAKAKIVLSAPSAKNKISKERNISPGSVIGVGAPCWYVTLDGEQWLVGVDWTIC